MKARLFFAAVAVAAVFFSCDDNPVDDGGGGGGGGSNAVADSIASYNFQALGDSLDALGDRNQDDLRDARFDDLRAGFQGVLGMDADNGIAHLGLAILEILELNYNTDLWAVVDSLESYDGSDLPLPSAGSQNVLIGRQFELMVTIPLGATLRRVTAFPSNVSVDQIQDLITNDILPAFDRAVNHLDVVEGRTATELSIVIDDGGVSETIIIDLGEILVFSAAVRAARGGFYIATAYDVDLWGPDGTYGWIDDIRALDEGDFCDQYAYDYTTQSSGGGIDVVFSRDQGRSNALEDSIAMRVLHHNMQNRPAFLSLRSGGTPMSMGRNSIVGALDRLQSAAAFIRSRPSETEENVIKLADLTDLDDNVTDPQGPNFAQNFNTIEDAIDFLQDLLSGPVDFTEDLGPNNISYSWTMNLSRIFINPVNDWNTLLPYHRWNLPVGAWLTTSLQYYTFNNGGGDWYELTWTPPSGCDYGIFTNVNMITYNYFNWDFDDSNVIELLDGPSGNPIDLDLDRFPYFPDYTFNGIFPGMARGDC